MSWPVFISYARKSSRSQAVALHELLGGAAFLDTSDIETGEHFPKVTVDALLGSRVVVLFVDDVYFERWYCLRELRTALSHWDTLMRQPGRTPETRESALESIIVALPHDGSAAILDRLPAGLRASSWPKASDTTALMKLVEARLRICGKTLEQQLAGSTSAASVRATLLEQSALPPAGNLAGMPVYPLNLRPSIGRRFVGRAGDLSRIHFALSTMRGQVATSIALTGSLEGGGGFGKTRIALEYVHRYGPAYYPGGLFWIDADVDPDRLEEQQHGILRTIAPATPDRRILCERGQTVAAELERAFHELPPEKPVLVIIDNLPEPSGGHPLQPLRAFCPGVGKVTILATSRMRLSLGVEGIEVLPVDVLDREAAVAMLSEELNRSDLDDCSWERIADWVGCLPLALELLNRAMRVGGVTPKELVERMGRVGTTEELDRLSLALRDEIPPGALRGVTEALTISYDRLGREERLAAEFIAQLSPDAIPVRILEILRINDPRTRSVLVARSFVNPIPGGPVPLFGTMHRIVADFLRHHAAEPLSQALDACRALLKILTPEACRNPSTWPLLKATLPHAETLFSRWAREVPAGASETMMTLGLAITQVIGSAGMQTSHGDFEEQLVVTAKAKLGTRHTLTVTAINNLADTLFHAGNLTRARQLFEEALSLLEAMGGPREQEISVRNNRANVLRELGHLTEAITGFEELAVLAENTLGADHDLTLSIRMNEGVARLQAGDPSRARAILEKVLKIRRQILGATHRDTITTMNNLAAVALQEERFTEARRWYLEVADARRELLDDEHPEVILAMNNVAGVRYAMADMEGLKDSCQRLLEVCRRALGDMHPLTLAVMHNLAAVVYTEDDALRARDLHEVALAGRTQLLGAHHPDTLQSKRSLAITLAKLGEIQEAQALLEEVLEHRRRLGGPDHPETIVVLTRLAELSVARGELVRAESLIEELFKPGRRIPLPERPVLERAIRTLIPRLEASGRTERLIDLRAWLSQLQIAMQ